MSMLGDVVFCVDCDRARLSRLQAVPGVSAELQLDLPRHMATKTDANGDPLCTACLDSRRAKRHADFMHERQAPMTAAPSPTGAVTGSPPRKKVEFVRILRTRPQEAEVATAPPRRAAAKSRTAKPANGTRKSTENGRELKRRFAMLVVEIGFVRAQKLLDELKTVTRRMTQ
jgi:hypothetical protein